MAAKLHIIEELSKQITFFLLSDGISIFLPKFAANKENEVRWQKTLT